MNHAIIPIRTCVVAAAVSLAVACGGQNDRTTQTRTDSTAIHHLTAAHDLLLVPGQSAGPIHLGDADTALHPVLGRPDFSNAAMGKAVLVWHTHSDTAEYPLSVFTSRDMGNDEIARIQQIRVTAPHFETSESIRVGSTLRDLSNTYSRSLRIVDTYSDDGQTYSIYDTQEGIAFEVDSANRCVAIIIHEEGTAVPTYLPLREIQ